MCKCIWIVKESSRKSTPEWPDCTLRVRFLSRPQCTQKWSSANMSMPTCLLLNHLKWTTLFVCFVLMDPLHDVRPGESLGLLAPSCALCPMLVLSAGVSSTTACRFALVLFGVRVVAIGCFRRDAKFADDRNDAFHHIWLQPMRTWRWATLKIYIFTKNEIHI